MSDPIPYQVRISPRARNVYLRMSPDTGLEVVVPRGYSLRKIPELIAAKRSWIEATRLRLEKRRLNRPPPEEKKLPEQITLPAINQTWRVEYVPEKSGRVKAKQVEPGVLRLTGEIQSMATCAKVLQLWLLQTARKSFPAWLRQVSDEVKLPFAEVSVRMQSSRWGSCSRTKGISLNAKLLFLSPAVVRYLFIHELCHTVHMNHSARYWGLVAVKDPGYKELDRSLRTAMDLVPWWAK